MPRKNMYDQPMMRATVGKQERDVGIYYVEGDGGRGCSCTLRKKEQEEEETQDQSREYL